ncbi:Uncharacterized conserved protein [bacterium A37T11]|nr:Uncharacterized conserved protein [bacterium A37T11]
MTQLIGWKDHIDLPEFVLMDIPAKIDTGAKTSVLHCRQVELIKKGRKQFVRFVPLDDRFGCSDKVYILPFYSERKIRNSFGQEENRYIIKTKIVLFNQTFDIELSLRDRAGMEFPVLLGRSFIRRKFLVDVSKSNVSKKQKTAKTN